MKIKFLLSLVLFLICNGYVGHGFASASTTTPSLPQANAAGNFNPQGYYTFRWSRVRCLTALCNGVFVNEVNRLLTRCPDGSLREECYVPFVINKKNIPFGTSGLLIKGAFVLQTYPNLGELYVFDVQAAFKLAAGRLVGGQFFGLKNNGIVCITSPCFSHNEYLLNRAIIRPISGLDLSAVGAPPNAIKQAYAILRNGGTLIATGFNKQVQEFAGLGVTFVATQFYLPIKPIAP